MTGSNVLFISRKQLKNLSVPLTGNGHVSGAGCLTFEQDLILFSEAGELGLVVDRKCSDVGNGIASTVSKSVLLCGIHLVALRLTGCLGTGS